MPKENIQKPNESESKIWERDEGMDESLEVSPEESSPSEGLTSSSDESYDNSEFNTEIGSDESKQHLKGKKPILH